MRFATMATGGVGGYLGSKLIAAGHEVAMVARGRHLEAIKTAGLTFEAPGSAVTVHPAIASENPAEIGPVDCVFFAVKIPDTEGAAAAVSPLVGPDTIVVPFQNGVDAVGALTSALGPDPVLSGVCYISANIAAPGRIQQTGTFARFVFGEVDGTQSDRTRNLRAVLTEAGIEAPEPKDVRVDVWKKFVFISALSGITAAARCTVADVRNDPAMLGVYERAVAEGVAVALALGVPLPPGTAESQARVIDTLPAEMRASQAHDLLAGKPLELEGLSGAVVRLGAEAGVDTPVHATFNAVLRPFLKGAPIAPKP